MTQAVTDGTNGQTVDAVEALRFAEEMAAEAAERALRHVRAGFDRQIKRDSSVVTEVDTAIERFLRERIEARYPDHAILGEEYGWDGRLDRPLWAIDPIDGTTNLAEGLPLWGISIALVVGDDPVAGVVAFPVIGETYAAARGHGATLNGEPLAPLGPGGPLRWADAYSICSASTREVEFRRTTCRLRVFGSAALDLCWAAAGRVGGCQSMHTKIYDVAAGVLIAREVGAETIWLDGRPWSAAEMAQAGPRAEVLLTAPKGTVAYLREHLSLRAPAA